MNVRIDKEGFRFRIIPADLSALLEGKELVESACGFTYRIVPVFSGLLMELRMANHGFYLLVPQATLEELRDMGRSKEGIGIQQGDAEISLQVDLKAQGRKAA